MHTRPILRRRGFTLLELLIVVVMISIISMMSIGRASDMVTGWRVNRAAQAYGEEIQSAFALVGRNRKPMTIVFRTDSMDMRIVDRAGVVYRHRYFGKISPYLLEAGNISASRLSVEVFPPGLAADSMSFTISRNGKFRRVRMLRGGLVQICANPASLNGVCAPA